MIHFEPHAHGNFVNPGGPAPQLSTAKLDEANIPTQIDNLIALHLHLWPALTAAIQNGWGTSSPEVGEDKRAWLAGSLSDMFAQSQLRDVEDVEDVLEQVMSDEFEVVVDDGSLEEIARNIWAGRARLLQGDTTEVTQLMGLWEERQKKKQRIQLTQGPEVDQETDEDEDDVDEAETWNGFKDTPDVHMGDAPPIPPQKKPEPEIDEDGFTKVVGKKKK
ncbi:rRNA accumulation- protein [Lithohypha guttulata]|nr:rRNA accumulation- protein [Lithohypha guttulata]